MPLRAKLVLPALLLYVATPIDLIPDFIPVLGQIDDLLIVGLGLWFFLRVCPHHVVREHLARLGALGDDAGAARAPTAPGSC